jgi:hypothetical protein
MVGLRADLVKNHAHGLGQLDKSSLRGLRVMSLFDNLQTLLV